MQSLVIVESPAKGRTLSRFLGEDFRVEASMGHVRDLPKADLGVDVADDFRPHYVVSKEKKVRVDELKRLSKDARLIYLATDPDREGEAIAWHITELLGKSTGKFKRVIFHEITEPAVREAFKHPRSIDHHLVDAQQARRILDRLVGYKLSPLLWRKVRKGLSAGRVQSVALRLVVDRQREIDAFRPEEYWTVEALLASHGGQFTAQLVTVKDKKATLKNETEAKVIEKQLLKVPFSVTNVSQKVVKRAPFPPFTTSTLQQMAHRLGFSARRTMSVAQRLYEEGYITYMRTDSVSLSAHAIERVRAYIAKTYGTQYVPTSPRIFRAKQKLAQEAHEAIRPSDPEKEPTRAKAELDRDQLKLYTLIWQRTVASQSSDASYHQVAVDIRASSYGFRANGSTITFEGWLKIMPQSSRVLDEEELYTLPKLSVGEQLKLEKLTSAQHFTQPPPTYSEATLIKALEEHGIGRPSTYAPILSTLQDRLYVELLDRRLIPTPLGLAVNDFLVTYFPNILDIAFTAHLEDRLDDIARGQEQWIPVIEQFFGPFEEDVTRVSEEAQRVKIATEETNETCPQCQKPIVVRIGRFGKFLACSGFPACTFTKPYLKKLGIPCPKCGGDVIVRRTKRKKTFYGCASYPHCEFASWTKPKVLAQA